MNSPTDSIARAAYFVGHGADGKQVLFESVTTPKDDTRPTIIVVPPETVVPIVFVPGIMGSNLMALNDIKNAEKTKVVVKKGKPVWRVDGSTSLLPWLTRSPDEYQLRLRADMLKVDPGGAIADDLLCQRRQHSPMAPLSVVQLRDRGWGEVAAMFYQEFLDWLEHSLNYATKDFTRANKPDNPVLASLKQIHLGQHPLGAVVGNVPVLSQKDVELLLSHYNPVHAMGYNWLQSNGDSGRELKARIEKIIKSYQAQGKHCEKVILVTHSMGGLVARAACKLHGADRLVAGVFHGVMPTDGAAAVYKRMVSGAGGEGGGFSGWAGAAVLGPTGNFTTPTLALNAGPLELLPNARYNAGKPWLFVKDPNGQTMALPQKGDPYSEIYAEEKLWWRPCNEGWLNPAGLDQKNQFDSFLTALGQAKYLHRDLQSKGDFHPNTHAHYGWDSTHLAYETVTWTLDKALTPAQHAALRRDDMNDADMAVTLITEDGTGVKKVKAKLSKPDAPGDGMVPAKASAQAVDRGVRGGILVRGTGYAHDQSYTDKKSSEGPRAALHAVLHILKTTQVAPKLTPAQPERRTA